MIRRRGQAARRPHSARPAAAPPAGPVTPRRTRPGDHIVLQTGLRCACGETAVAWARCRYAACRAIVATCGGHNYQTAVQARGDHERTHQR